MNNTIKPNIPLYEWQNDTTSFQSNASWMWLMLYGTSSFQQDIHVLQCSSCQLNGLTSLSSGQCGFYPSGWWVTHREPYYLLPHFWDCHIVTISVTCFQVCALKCVCVCVCVRVCVHGCVRACRRACVHARVFAFVCVHARVCFRLCMCMCVCA